MEQELEEYEFHYSSDAELDRAEARELGEANPEWAWVCTSRDAWHKNPYYVGPPVPHPEDDGPREDLREGDELPGPIWQTAVESSNEIPF